MDQAVKEELIAQFRAYLEQVGDEPVPEEEAFSLLAELSGLKTEVKRESRQVKEALEQFKSMFSTLQANNETLSRELENRRTAEKTLWRQALRPLLLQLLDLRDRLEAGLELDMPPRHPLLAGLCQRQNQRLESFREGQSMTLRRLDRILGDYRVQALEVLDKPLDPYTMRVLEVEFRPDQAQGIVTGELRKGFLWDEELLRPAEVKVNKRDDKP